MRIVVVGAGIIGITTAFMLCCSGHEVVVVDREVGPGRQTSFANGSLLTPSIPEPWNAPGSWRLLLSSLVRPVAALKLRVKALPSVAPWGVRFLKNSSPRFFERNTLSNWLLARYSLRAMATLRSEVGVSYERAASGTLRIFRNGRAFERAARAVEKLVCEDVRIRKMSTGEAIALEPALLPIRDRLAGAIFCETDETGDAYQFCVGLAQEACRRGVQFRYCVKAERLMMRSGQVRAIETSQGEISGDVYVIAAGSYSRLLLQSVGIRLPVQPAKGYSITLNRGTGRPSLSVPIVDDDLHAVLVPLKDRIRVAGTAEFAGYDLSLPEARVRNLTNLLREVLPKASFDSQHATAWCGLRPMSADGVPAVGGTALANLYVNTGHGHLGWTMAMGSARLVRDLIEKRPTEVDAGRYSLERFAASASA